jgi:glucose/arabinose dehydrogenase
MHTTPVSSCAAARARAGRQAVDGCGGSRQPTQERATRPSPLRRRVAGLAAVALLGLVSGATARSGDNQRDGSDRGPQQADEYRCYFTEAVITVDGRGDEAAWKTAAVIDDFHLAGAAGDKRRPSSATRARLLWDREFLYFLAEMEDTDLYADVMEHDGPTWHNDVFELFFKPASDKPGYYEFQVSAANTRLDAFYPRRGAGGWRRFGAEGTFDFQTAVHRDGTLNRWSDRDRAWTVEGRLAWKDLARTGGRPDPDEVWTFALCRYDYSVDFEGPQLSSNAPLTVADFHRYEQYVPIRFVGPGQSPADEARPRGISRRVPLTTSRVAGSPEPPPPFTVERVFPNLKLDMPVVLRRQPGSDLVWIATQPTSFGPTTLYRFRDTPDAEELETLLAAEGDATVYDIAFHPRFADNGLVFIGSNGSYGGPKRSRITRYYVEPRAPYRFDPSSATTIIEWESDGHNGAAVTFGHDGMLYVTSGDGTSDSDTLLRGQDLTHLTAKVLRIDVDRPAPGQTYRVPDDNPFVGQEGIRPETWCYGFRNPWRITTDAQTGRIWVAQNGQDLWEQVYLIERGANYGWSVKEGAYDFYPNRQRGPHPIHKPVVDHPHSEARSLTGGIVYHGEQPQLAELRGAYLYGDYSTGKIWALWHDGQQVLKHREIADTPLAITCFELGSGDEVWILDHLGRGVYRLVPRPEDAPAYDFPRRLSESGLFQDVARHVMAPGVIPYSVNSPLWSDGAHKERWIAIAERPGEEPWIAAQDDNGWTFPNGTVLVKSFALEQTVGDPGSRRWIETRFLVRQQNEWAGYSYRWNESGTDAELVDAQGLDVEFTLRDPAAPHGVRRQTWRYPSRSECMVCHSRAANFVLGLQTAQMNREHDYGGVVDNQLRVLEHLGLLRVDWGAENRRRVRRDIEAQVRAEASAAAGDDVEAEIQRRIDERVRRQLDTRDQRPAPRESPLLYQPPERLPRMVDPYDTSQPLEARARSYLHANCAHCHVLAGGGNAAIDLKLSTPLREMRLLDEAPRHHTFGLPEARLVAPGAPDRSVLLHRLKVRGAGQMPQLATSVADAEAIALLRQWIESLRRQGASGH